MKLILSVTVLVATAPLLGAQVVVTNPVSDVLSEEMHLEDLTKWVQSIENQVQQINTLTQQLQQVQAYVKAFGDPEKLLSITGADQLISSLQQSGVGQTMAALDLCKRIPPARKTYHLQTGAGHYGVFSGRAWQNQIYPKLRAMIGAV